MTPVSKLMCGIILLTVPTIEYGGYFLLSILSGKQKIALTDFQKSMFRAGHAHAGVLVILALLVPPEVLEVLALLVMLELLALLGPSGLQELLGFLE